MRFMFLAVMALMFVGCNKGSSSSDSGSKATVGVTSTGECTDSLISDYNDLMNSVDFLEQFDSTLSDEKFKQELNVLKQKCQSFTSKYGAVNCRARNIQSGAQVEIKGSEIQEGCSKLNQF